jgi:hypothetical protein
MGCAAVGAFHSSCASPWNYRCARSAQVCAGAPTANDNAFILRAGLVANVWCAEQGSDSPPEERVADAVPACLKQAPRQPTRRNSNATKVHVMLYTIAVVLLILWLLGLVTSYTMGGFIHILLVVAVVMVLVNVISGRRV